MGVRQQTVTDGITSETQTVISAPRSRLELREDEKAIRALVAEQNRVSTFSGRVADLERTCRHMPGLGRDGHQQRPAYGSRAWYAEEILSSIQVVRDAFARGDSQLAASEAVVVGALAAAAEAKFRWGGLMLQRARRTKNRELSQRSADARRATTADRDTGIIAASRAYRVKHPTHSTRNMAMSIASSIDMKAGTVRDRLRRLNIR
jgi:hypothetical protein